MTSDVMLSVQDVQHVYGGGNRALAGVTLDIHRGEFLAVIGKNGSGKTTLAKHLNGLLRPTNPEGRVVVHPQDGEPFATRDQPLYKVSRWVGYVFQNPDAQIFHDTCREELEFGLKNHKVPEAERAARVSETLALVDLAGSEEANPAQMSRGERQRLAIAATLVMRPDVVIVDEPTTGQDRREGVLILELLRRFNQDGHTVVVVSHDMALVAEYATRIVAMRSGSVLADGPPREVFAMTEVLETTNIRPPQATVLALRLGHPGVLSVPEATAAIAGVAR